MRERLAGAAVLNRAVAETVEQPAVAIPEIKDLLAIQVEPPVPQPDGPRAKEESPIGRPPVGCNYLELEARSRSLGCAGEELALRFERERLLRIGESKLASRIRHVSQTEGDHLGYDILSFEVDGRERLIEVKTTRFGAWTPFFASRNEVDVSERRDKQYQLYRVFTFSSQPRLFALPGSLRRSCRLDPFTYSAIPA